MASSQSSPAQASAYRRPELNAVRQVSPQSVMALSISRPDSKSWLHKPGENGLLMFSKSFPEVLGPRDCLRHNSSEFVRIKFKFPPVIVLKEGIFNHPRGTFTS